MIPARPEPNEVIYPRGRRLFQAMVWFGGISLVVGLWVVVAQGPSLRAAVNTVLVVFVIVQGYTMGRRQVQITSVGLTWCDGWRWHEAGWDDVVGMPEPTRWGPGEGKLILTEAEPVPLLPLRPEGMQRVRDAVQERARGGEGRAAGG